MAETTNITAAQAKPSWFQRLKSRLYEDRWWILFVLAGGLLFTLPPWGRGRNFGFAAWVCSIAIAYSINAFWAARRERWFWIASALILLAHLAVLLSVHWTNDHHFGAEYKGYGELDFIATYGIFMDFRRNCEVVQFK